MSKQAIDYLRNLVAMAVRAGCSVSNYMSDRPRVVNRRAEEAETKLHEEQERSLSAIVEKRRAVQIAKTWHAACDQRSPEWYADAEALRSFDA